MIQDQPKPKPTGTRPIWELVVEDMQQRDRVGRERYGTPLQANNGRDGLIDAYQEVLDLAVYVRQVIEEEVVASHAVQALGVRLLGALEACQKEIKRSEDLEIASMWNSRATGYREVLVWVEELFPHAFASTKASKPAPAPPDQL